MPRPIPCPEAGEGAVEIERGIRELGPAGERETMLDLFLAPMLDVADRLLRRAAIDPLEVGDIIGRVVLDQRRRLHGGEQTWVDLGRLEARPIHVVQRPARAVDHAIGHPQPSWPMSEMDGISLAQLPRAGQTSR